jgi:hypothetical protein
MQDSLIMAGLKLITDRGKADPNEGEVRGRLHICSQLLAVV